MIVSETPKKSNTRWLQACVLVGAMLVLPLGIASAQDYEAVGKRLKESVMKGEITPPQADAMMAALKKEAAKDQGHAGLDATWEKLQAQVRAGELTKEQARDKMMALKSEAAQKNQDLEKATADLMKLKQDLGAAVEAGKISKEDAVKKYEAAKRGIKEKEAAKSQSPADLNAIWEKLQAQVRAGEITKDQAIEKMTAIKSEAARKDIKDKPVAKKDQAPDKAPVVLKKVKKDRSAAVKSGKISKKGPAKKDEVAATDGKDKTAAKEDRDLDKATTGPTKVKKDRGAAVEAGKMTREEAGERLEAYKKSLGQGTQAKDQGKELDLAGISRRLQAAVAAGEMTEKEAKAKWEAIKKQAGAKDKDKD